MYPIAAQKRSKYPLRMVTLLIQDMRSGTIDHQLAEVKVPLRQSDVPEDGFWADSRDIVRAISFFPPPIFLYLCALPTGLPTATWAIEDRRYVVIYLGSFHLIHLFLCLQVLQEHIHYGENTGNLFSV
jgi:hypothetical protein